MDALKRLRSINTTNADKQAAEYRKNRVSAGLKTETAEPKKETSGVQSSAARDAGVRQSYADRQTGSRLGNLLSGAGKQYVSGVSSGLSTMYEAGTRGQAQEREREIQDLQRRLQLMDAGHQDFLKTGKADAAYMKEHQEARAALEAQIAQLQTISRAQAGAVSESHKLADQLAESGSKDLEKAKTGLGSVGRFAVDVGAGAAQLGADVALGVATGGGTMVPLALRSFGGGAQEARNDGATIDQQVAYGAASALTEVLTEKIFSVGKFQTKAFGKGTLDDIMKGVVAAVEDAGKTKAGKAVLNRVASTGVGFLSEGLEEAVSGVVNPILQKGIYDKQVDWSQVMHDVAYDFLVGGAIGGLMGGAGGTDTSGAQRKSTSPATETPSPVAETPVQKAVDKAQSVPYNENVITPEATVLNHGASLYAALGMKAKKAEAKAVVVQKLIDGKDVSIGELKSLNLSDAKYQSIFTELTGVDLSTAKNEDLRFNLARTAHEVAEQRKATEAVVAQTQARAAELSETRMAGDAAAQNVAARASERVAEAAKVAEARDPGNGPADFETFAKAYREMVKPEATDTEIQQSYEGYMAEAQTIQTKGGSVTRAQFRQMMRKTEKGANLSDEELNAFFDFALKNESDGGMPLFNVGEEAVTDGGAESEQAQSIDEGAAGSREARARFSAAAGERGQTVRVFEGNAGSRGEGRPRLARFSEVKEPSQIAAETVSELEKLGVPAFVHAGDLEVLANDGVVLEAHESAATVNDSAVGVANDIDIPAKETAGHEAYHFHDGKPVRDTYAEVVAENVDLGSEAFESLFEDINSDYFGGSYDIGSPKHRDQFQEEMTAYVSGYIHNNSVPEGLLLDESAVREAWEKFTSTVRKEGVNENGASVRGEQGALGENDPRAAQNGAGVSPQDGERGPDRRGGTGRNRSRDAGVGLRGVAEEENQVSQEGATGAESRPAGAPFVVEDAADLPSYPTWSRAYFDMERDKSFNLEIAEPPGLSGEAEVGYEKKNGEWVTLATYPATDKGLKQFHEDLPRLLNQSDPGLLSKSGGKKGYGKVEYDLYADDPESLGLGKAAKDAARVGVKLNVVKGKFMESPDGTGRSINGFMSAKTREIFTVANEQTADHEVMHAYLSADHDFRNRLVEHIKSSSMAEDFRRACEAAREMWSSYAAYYELECPDPSVRDWFLDYALENEVLCEARAGNLKLGDHADGGKHGPSFMKKLIPYVQRETAKWEKEWDATEHGKITLKSDPNNDELIAAFGEDSEAGFDDGFYDPYGVERYLPSGELDSDGNELSVEQSKRFANSKIRNRAGELLKLYHGTPRFGFTEFKRKESLDKRSFFLSDSVDVARSYSGARAVRSTVDPNPNWDEMSTPELVEAFNQTSITHETIRASKKNPELLVNMRTGKRTSREEIIEYLKSEYAAPVGNIPGYAYAENPLIVDADGATWSRIPVPEEIREAFQAKYNKDSASTDQLAEFAEANGYDGLMIYDCYDMGRFPSFHGEATIVVVFESNQFKDAYNLQPTDSPDFRYDMPATPNREQFKEKFDAMYGAGSAEALFAAADEAFTQASKAPTPKAPASQGDESMTGWVIYGKNAGAAALGFDPYSYLQNEYGTIEQTGKNNHRIVDVPKSTNGRDKASKTASTVMGAKATPDGRLGDIAQAVVDRKLSYYPVKNKIAENKARARIRKVGFNEAVSEWTEAVDKGRVNSDLVAMGATLLNNAGNSDMTGRSYTTLMAKYAQLLRSAGQALQAANIFKKMSPEAKLYTVVRQVEEINNRHNTGLPVSMWMDEVGELLADEIYKLIDVKEPRARVKSVADTILSDLTKYARELVARESVSGTTTTRTEMERLQDLFGNKDKYDEAWQVAKNRLVDEFGADANFYAALEAWAKSELTIADKLTKILTKQNEVVMDEALAEEYLAAETDEAREEVMDRILQNIADQIPATKMDKFTALRYTGMLGNLRTNVRNVAGNSLMQMVRLTKTTFAGLAEALIQKAGVNMERSTSLVRDKETLKAAKEDFKSVREIIAGGGKYQDNHTDISQEIRKRQRIFKTAWLEGLRKGSGWLMENEYFGDAAFSSFTYADALARYIAANGTSWSRASEELKDKARAVAIREAAEATFRDNNALSEAVAKMRFRDPKNVVERGINLVAEGLLPFRKTPANVLMRSIEYSPIGLATTMAQTARTAANKTELTAADLINSAAKGLTGSGILLAGMGLAAMGYLKGKAPDDEKEKELWEMQGHQAYALEIDGTSYTIDWAAPLSIPLLVGAELHEALLSEGLTVREAANVASAVFDPLLEMSMLQGINDAISNAQTYGDESALVRFVGNALWSYVTQPIPTLLGQVERSGANARMTTYVDKNRDTPDAVQRALGKASAKLPGWDYAQVQYIDAWGRTQQNADTQTLNVIEQFLSPGYANVVTETAMEKELVRLHQATGDAAVLIKSAPKYFNVGGARKDLTADEYLVYAKTRGQTAFSLATDITKSETYQGLGDKEKAAAVSKAYDYANQVAKELVTNGAAVPEKWVREAQVGAAEYGIPVSTYLTVYAATKDIASIKDKDGETVDNSKALRVLNTIYSVPGLSEEQVKKLAEDFDVNKTVRKYNAKMVQSKLAAMEKKYG